MATVICGPPNLHYSQHHANPAQPKTASFSICDLRFITDQRPHPHISEALPTPHRGATCCTEIPDRRRHRGLHSLPIPNSFKPPQHACPISFSDDQVTTGPPTSSITSGEKRCKRRMWSHKAVNASSYHWPHPHNSGVVIGGWASWSRLPNFTSTQTGSHRGRGRTAGRRLG